MPESTEPTAMPAAPPTPPPSKRVREDLYGMRVTLIPDLTRYHPGLVAGVQGVAVPPCTKLARVTLGYVSVRFPFGDWDIVVKSLEVADDEPADPEMRKSSLAAMYQRLNQNIDNVTSLAIREEMRQKINEIEAEWARLRGLSGRTA